MKKIGFCINSLEVGGAEKLLVDIVNLLTSTNKYEISILTKNESNSFFYNEIKNKINYNYLISQKTEKKCRKYGKIGRFISSVIKIKNFKKFSSEIDVIIDFLDGDFYKYIRRENKKEKIIWLHSNYMKLMKEKKIEKKLLYYNKILLITKEMYKKVEKSYTGYKMYNIYNMVDYEKITNLLKEEFKKDEEYFLTVCRLDEKDKDVSSLIKAFSKYKGNEKLYIIGDGESRKQLEELARVFKIENRVKFLGIQKNPYKYMKSAKLFIFSSKAEGFGLVVAEALYCGTKVVASDCDYGPREILLNGEIGELFEVGNVDELLNKIELANTKEYSRMKIENSLKRFNKQEFLINFEKILEELKN